MHWKAGIIQAWYISDQVAAEKETGFAVISVYVMNTSLVFEAYLWGSMVPEKVVAAGWLLGDGVPPPREEK